MAYRVVVMKEVSRLARGWGLSREAVVRLWTKLYTDLEAQETADALRKKRAPVDPERLFLYQVNFLDNDRWHTFRFAVDDCQATGFLFVVNAGHDAGAI